MFCEICRTIPFQEIRDGKHVRGIDEWVLGTLPELQKRQDCSLCSFFLKATCDKRVVRWLGAYWEKTAITLSWYDGSDLFRLSSNGLGTTIRFMSGNSFCGIGRDLTDTHIEAGLINTWLQECQSRHISTCPPPSMDAMDFEQNSFRFIDVQRLCIVQISIPSSYAALSYVWGQAKSLRLTKNNQRDLMADQGLDREWDKIPLTIRDAICLLQKMGIRYLWVDSVCLVQDAEDDVASGIQKMDMIYERSLFTIIAASGTDANSGLPGVQTRSRSTLQVTCEVSPGLRLLLAQEMEATIRLTKYNARAWTFQEFMLSRRRVVFLNEMVYFQCRKCAWAEDIQGLPDIQAEATLLSTVQLDDRDFDSHDILTNLLNYYSSRKATYETDYLVAMAGMFRRIAKRTKCRFLYGIPVAAFDVYLLFYHFTDTPFARRPDFPSWSWAGWSGEVLFEDIHSSKNDWLTNNTWIIWYERSLSGVVSLVWDPATQDARGDVSYIRRQGFPRGLGFDSIPTSQVMPSWDLPHEINLPSYPILQFWTMVVYYELRMRKESEDSAVNVSVDSFAARTHLYVLPKATEFIILSKTGEKLKPGGSKIDEDGEVCWAMWVEWKAGVAERKDIARVNCNSLVNSHAPGPMWKEILLA